MNCTCLEKQENLNFLIILLKIKHKKDKVKYNFWDTRYRMNHEHFKVVGYLMIKHSSGRVSVPNPVTLTLEEKHDIQQNYFCL